MASRFISQDPLGEEANGPNVYLYAENAPTMGTDPYGTDLRIPEPDGGEGIAGNRTGTSTGGLEGNGDSGAGGANFGPSPGACAGPNKGAGGGSDGGGIVEEVNCNLYERLGEAAQKQGEEMGDHHCHNNQVVINHHCFSPPPGPPEYPPPEHPLEPGWPVIPIIPIPIPIPLPIPD